MFTPVQVYRNPASIEEESEYELLSDDQLLEEMVRAIVSKPDKVKIEEYCDTTRGEAWKVLLVRVDSEDCGKVIGRQGRTASLLRDFIKLVGIQRGYPLTVLIEGNNGHREQRLTKNGIDPEVCHLKGNNGLNL